MVSWAGLRGVGLFLLLGTAAVLIHASGTGYHPVRHWLPAPWYWIVVALLALALPVLLGLALAGAVRRPGGRAATITTFLVAIAGAGIFLANFQVDSPFVNSLIPFTGVERAAVPASAEFPILVESTGGGRFTAVVGNQTDDRATIWCFVEASIGSRTIVFKDYKVESIPAGGTSSFDGELEGSAVGPYASGCNRTSY